MPTEKEAALVDEASLDTVRSHARAGNIAIADAVDVGSMSLGACIEAACWWYLDEAARELLERWAASVPRLGLAIRALRSGRAPPVPEEHSAPAFELRRAPSRTELNSEGTDWFMFHDRFRRSLIERRGFQRTAAIQIQAGLWEMVDNAVSHAGLSDAPLGCVAYEVGQQAFCFAVGDVGRGVLASLRENPVHQHLGTSGEALRAAVMERASARSPVGTGFDQLVRALADHDAVLTFRSGDSRLTLDGRGLGQRKTTFSSSPKMAGFQLVVESSRNRP